MSCGILKKNIFDTETEAKPLPTLPSKPTNTKTMVNSNQETRTTPISPKLAYTYNESDNEDIYHMEGSTTFPLNTLSKPNKYERKSQVKGGEISGTPLNTKELENSGLRRKELPSPPLRSETSFYNHESTGFLSEEEVDTVNLDVTNFSRVLSKQLQLNPLDSKTNTMNSHLPNSNSDLNTNNKTNPSKYGQLGNGNRSTKPKPLPKPRTTSGTLELTQSELKLAYFQATSLQTQLETQQKEIVELEQQTIEYKKENSKLSTELEKITENEKELKKELSEMRDMMNAMKMENILLNQQKDALFIENNQRMESLHRQVAYLKMELIKSATYADSAIKQILMGVTNAHQVMECLNSLGKISPED
ncbi:hypothetical protein K7432_010996 [Basidiobolus ranarum]|uniref:Endosome-associated-trafficking regulator 1 n=1 Tax=Basidiobolus ranarum TaxID=34480 RepID=A0ABR2WMY6_9FUNG